MHNDADLIANVYTETYVPILHICLYVVERKKPAPKYPWPIFFTIRTLSY